MKNGVGSLWCILFMVIECFCMVFSRVVCVLGGVWLILFVSMILVNSGLGVNLK